MKDTITIHDATIQNDGRKITNFIEATPNAQRFFKSNIFWAEYDRSITDVPLSILNIPALSTIIHFAMAVGCDVSIGEVDKTYLKGIEKTKKLLRYHPGFQAMSFDCTVHAEPIENTFNGDKKGMLFSGGVDSTSSRIAHLHEKPTLIFIRGIDMPLSWKAFWHRVVDHYKHLGLRTIESNTEEIYGLQHAQLGKNIMEGYMPGYSFSINRLGVCAPLTVAEGIDTLMLSSTYPEREYGDPDYPWTRNRVNWIIDEYLSWADVEVYDVEGEYTTTEKIQQLIKPHFQEHGPSTIRSCGHVRFLGTVNTIWFNCCRCDKCQRVIGSLAVSGVDPRTCGFPTTPKTYEQMRFDTEKLVWNPFYLYYHWKEVQRLIPDEITEDFGGSKAFLEWLRGHRFD